MKNVLKVFGACLLMCGVIALIVCMCAIPNKTKAFFDIVVEYLDKPIVLCGVSITIGGILLYFITRYVLINTSYGKKYLKDLNNKLELLEKIIDSVDERQEKKTNTLIETYTEAFETYKEQYDKVESALKLIPNKKVQEVLNNGEETKDN